MPILRRSDGLYCCLCFYSGNVADCAASSGEESGKIRTNFPMVISPIGDLLYHAASLAVIVILLARHDVCGEIFCFSTSSSFVVFVGVAWSWRASTSSPMTCMVGVQEESCWILLLLLLLSTLGMLSSFVWIFRVLDVFGRAPPQSSAGVLRGGSGRPRLWRAAAVRGKSGVRGLGFGCGQVVLAMRVEAEACK